MIAHDLSVLIACQCNCRAVSAIYLGLSLITALCRRDSSKAT